MQATHLVFNFPANEVTAHVVDTDGVARSLTQPIPDGAMWLDQLLGAFGAARAPQLTRVGLAPGTPREPVA